MHLTSTPRNAYTATVKRIRTEVIPTSDITVQTVVADGFTLSQTDHAGNTSTARRGYTAVSMALMQSYEAGRALHTGMYYKRENIGVKEREYSYAYDNDADDKFPAACDQLRSGHPCLWLILWIRPSPSPRALSPSRKMAHGTATAGSSPGISAKSTPRYD